VIIRRTSLANDPVLDGQSRYRVVVKMEARRICLDTTFLIDLLRELPDAVQKAKQLKEAGSDVCTTSISAFELYIGAIRSASAKRISRLEVPWQGSLHRPSKDRNAS